MTQKLMKQVVGVDVAQKELVVCLGRLWDDLRQELYASKTVSNDMAGFKALIQWVDKNTDKSIPISFVMEATGVYHESFAYYLTDQQALVSIVLPNKISNYSRSLSTKTVTDKTASQAIAQFGLERALENWKQPHRGYRKMRQLTRERDQIVAESTMLKNQLHAEQAEAMPNKSTISRFKKRLSLLNTQKKEVETELRQLVQSSEQIKEQVDLLGTISGVGFLTAATVLAETSGFDLVRSRRQLASYAGLDVIEKQSGTSIKGKTRISKKGNKYLRKALHLPALTAIRSDARFKAIFARLVAKHGIKMKAAVAVQRKMLELMYTIHKTKTPYQKDFQQSLTNTPEMEKICA